MAGSQQSHCPGFQCGRCIPGHDSAGKLTFRAVVLCGWAGFQYLWGGTLLSGFHDAKDAGRFRQLGLGGKWGFIHFEACLPALAVPGNIGWRARIRVHFWVPWQPAASDDLSLDRELLVPDGFPGNGCIWARLTGY